MRHWILLLMLVILALGCVQPPSEDEVLLFQCEGYKTALMRDDCLKNVAPQLVGNYTDRAIETCAGINITLFKDNCYRQLADKLAIDDFELAMDLCGRVGYQNHSLACERSVKAIASG